MKRISLFFIALLMLAGTGLRAQTPVEGATAVLNYSGLDAKLKKSDSDIQNAKKNTKAKTWTSRAQVLLDINNVHNDILSRGMDPARVKLLMKEPTEIQTSQEGPNSIEVYVYDKVDLKFVNGALEGWTEKNRIHPDPLTEAQKALDEAIKLNTDGKADTDVKRVTEELKRAYQNEAIVKYEAQDYQSSYENFNNILKLNQLPHMNNQIDTIIVYFAGRAAFENKDYAEASRLFEQTASYNYNDPLLYVLRKQAFFGIGDTAKGVEAINEGFNRYPEDQSIMIEMINYYLDTDQAEQALGMIQKAKAGDPNNVSYTFTEGTLYDKMGRIEDAEKAYKQCIEMKPDYYDAHYNLGVLYYNEAVKIYEEASNIADNAAFEKKQAEGDEALKLAIPYMEKVAAMETSNQGEFDTKRSALETLRTVYYRLKMEDKRQEVMNKLNAM
ncbi:MAG TPA: tetratricopeptide repeat protein [Bacteroidales bacterium]|nr:tetratricopeptide repeat protein [Bacteroidales bacterium]